MITMKYLLIKINDELCIIINNNNIIVYLIFVEKIFIIAKMSFFFNSFKFEIKIQFPLLTHDYLLIL